MSVRLEPPEPLAEHRRLDDFECGEESLDTWLKRRARSNQASGASRTFVSCEERIVVGFYALAAGAVTVASAPGKLKRNMPDPMPMAVLGRLAVDRKYQGQGLGRGLFRDCALRISHAADAIGIRGILVHAISEEARAFYVALGFEASPGSAMTLMVTLADVRRALG